MYRVMGILGAAMIIAPFTLKYNTNNIAMWTSMVLGGIVLLASIAEALEERRAKWAYAVAGIAGVLAITAPFILGFSMVTTALWTTILLGVILLILASYEVFFVPEPS